MSQFTWPERPDEAHNHAAPQAPADAGELADGGDALTAPEQAVERTLLADGAAWRRNITPALPGVDDFVARASQRLASERATTATPRPSTATRASQPVAKATQRAPTPSLNLPSTNRGPLQKGTYPVTQSRWRGLAGVAAAVIVVGLIGLLLAHNLGARSQTGGLGTATPTQIPTPHGGATPTPGGSNLTGSPTYPVIAPSNPQIVYNVMGNPAYIERSTNGGQTYTRVTTPQTTLAGASFVVAVSPLDANHLIATATGNVSANPGNCQSASAQITSAADPRQQRSLTDTLSGYGPCSQNFFSADGGVTWSAVKLPFTGVIGSTADLRTGISTIFTPTATLFAQGTRLYAATGASSEYGAIIGAPPTQVVVSADDGATWQVASNGLGANICDFAPAPTGNTVYAIVAASSCNNESPSALTLWRSNNAGASWAQVSDLPTTNELGMAVSPSGAVYINMPRTLSSGQSHEGPTVDPSPSAVIVSVDGGVNFTRAPLAGAPASVAFAGPVGVLSDGSIVVTTTLHDTQGDQTTLYAWKAGATAWRKLGATLPHAIVEVIVVSQGGHDALYVVNDAGQVSHFTV